MLALTLDVPRNKAMPPQVTYDALCFMAATISQAALPGLFTFPRLQCIDLGSIPAQLPRHSEQYDATAGHPGMLHSLCQQVIDLCGFSCSIMLWCMVIL